MIAHKPPGICEPFTVESLRAMLHRPFKAAFPEVWTGARCPPVLLAQLADAYVPPHGEPPADVALAEPVYHRPERLGEPS